MKIGRNTLCPCGSGKKFKKCHGGFVLPLISTVPPFRSREMEAVELQRQKQQGKGRPILSKIQNEKRLVKVGDRTYQIERGDTFHDFLLMYIGDVLRGRWADQESQKSRAERHVLLNWLEDTSQYLKTKIKVPGKVHKADTIGSAMGLIGLAHNLYLIAHNSKLQDFLLKRLKNADQFLPAYYETCVFGMLIRAGCDIEFENETDYTTTHCEATAIFRETGRKFAVEAKMRQKDTLSIDIGRQLKKALRKRAEYDRIIFIEANIPDEPDENGNVGAMREILLDQIHRREAEDFSPGTPLPPAYIVVTNSTHLHFLDRQAKDWALAEGFKIPDFKFSSGYVSLDAAIAAKEKHREIFAILEAWGDLQIPATFDGDMPELAFGSTHSRLKIGNSYKIPDANGYEVTGVLINAVVDVSNSLCYGIYRTDVGQNLVSSCPLTNDEVDAYTRHPETFFGVINTSPKQISDPMGWYEWFFETYRSASKEKILEFMGPCVDLNKLKELSQPELAKLYCKQLAYRVISQPV